MRLLCTNDDGILALGLDCLVRAVQSLGEVTVVAPDREQSATSHSLTMHHPLRVKPRGERRFQVDGTPTDCVMLAVEALMPARPDFVLSGINHGQNMGEDVLYSGTVAAAMEGLALGVPSIAISFAGGDHGSVDPSMLPAQIPAVSQLLGHILSLRLPSDTLLNINLPPQAPKGVRLTRLGRRVFSDPLRRMQDPWGKEVYWIGGGVMAWTGGPDSDYQAIEDGYVSVTPLHLDLTHYDMLASAADWWRDP
ncbi:MAG TPA: 5'/3'-nucleotidase SurE [Gemmatimonadaceae bacterium]|nr:5'/3'-nucleotidase SurE [Gemmatimonadaceae bacterium]